MIDTVVYRVGYIPDFILSEEIVPFMHAVNPLVRDFEGRKGYTIY